MPTEKRRKLDLETKNFIEYKLIHLNEIKSELRRYKLDMIPSCTPTYSGMPGSRDPEARQIENLVMKMQTDAHLFEMERTVKKFDSVLDKLTKQDRKLVNLVYEKRSHTKEGAALACHMSKTVAYERINAILTELAVEMGYVNLK